MKIKHLIFGILFGASISTLLVVLFLIDNEPTMGGLAAAWIFYWYYLALGAIITIVGIINIASYKILGVLNTLFFAIPAALLPFLTMLVLRLVL